MPLKHDIGDDYTLDGRFAWITVEDMSVFVHRTEEGVIVDIFPRGKEVDDPIASTYAYFGEA